MRYVLRLEAIGDNHVAYLRHHLKTNGRQFGRRELDAFRYGNKTHVPWCALITGVSTDDKIQRQFMDGQRDYSGTNSTGSRGIFIYYALRPGLYEINSPETWRRVQRYFARVVDDETLEAISEKELRSCLKNAT